MPEVAVELQLTSLNRLLCLVSSRKAQRYSVYYNERQGKASNPHIWEVTTTKFCLNESMNRLIVFLVTGSIHLKTLMTSLFSLSASLCEQSEQHEDKIICQGSNSLSHDRFLYSICDFLCASLTGLKWAELIKKKRWCHMLLCTNWNLASSTVSSCLKSAQLMSLWQNLNLLAPFVACNMLCTNI